jgi:dTDP-4-amino-4,6-dideoxygalactose transaminase
MEFRDLKQQYKTYKEEIDSAIQEVLDNTNFISGSQVKQLEQKLSEFVGIRHCITCGNGTDALLLALMAWGIKEGDAVFVPDFTFFASGEVVSVCGATPVFVDVEKDTFNISVSYLEDAIKTVLKEGKLVPRVIIAVDLFGQPANFIEIRKIADRYGLFILEDGAQGFGGAIGENRACSFGDISTTSFFPAKPLGCYGDGGAVFTDNDEWAAIISSLCVHGKGKDKYDNIRIGMNSRLDTIQAAILQVKLEKFIATELGQVNKVAEWYDEELKNSDVNCPRILDGFYSSWAQYTIVCKDSEQRTAIQQRLKDKEIPSMIYYAKGLHEQKALEGKGRMVGNYENTNYLTQRVLSLPMHPYIKSDEIRIMAGEINNN